VIEARAPGKVVLWGEYAVLTGAPALVMAVDRYARCQITAGAHAWTFSAHGYAAPDERVSVSRLLTVDPPPPDRAWYVAWQVLRGLDTRRLPEGGFVHLDTRSLHHDGSKLGLGSSAAICVAAYGAFCRLLGQAPDYASALTVHRHLQGGSGSGIDVAAAWYGGTLRFERDAPGSTHVTPWPLPASLHLVFVWSGRPARTVDHLARFDKWREHGHSEPLQALEAASRRLFESAEPWACLTDYVAALEALDRAAGLDIYSPAHARLRDLAISAGVVYKPCGAGGGDLGAAFTPDAAAARRFASLAAANGFHLVPLETALHGFEVTG
jgi:phosphomevalonate kinase